MARPLDPGDAGSLALCFPDESTGGDVARMLIAAGHDVAVSGTDLAALNGAIGDAAPTCLILDSSALLRELGPKLRAVRKQQAELRIVLIRERVTGTEVRRALELGIDAVVLSKDVGAALPAVIAAVLSGQVTVPRQRRAHIRTAALTNREKQILGLVVMRMTNGEIAGKLYLAESTVKSHLSSAFAKLGVSSRNEAVGLILDPERGAGLGILNVPAERIPAPA